MIRLYFYYFFFFFNDTATTEIYTLSLHDALPIFPFTLTTQSRTESRHHREPDAGETKRRGLLYHWCGADIDSLRRHLVVVASRGRTCLAHLDKPQGSTMTDSFTLPFLHVQDNIGEVDHSILYRLVQDMRVKSRDTN